MLHNETPLGALATVVPSALQHVQFTAVVPQLPSNTQSSVASRVQFSSGGIITIVLFAKQFAVVPFPPHAHIHTHLVPFHVTLLGTHELHNPVVGMVE